MMRPRQALWVIFGLAVAGGILAVALSHLLTFMGVPWLAAQLLLAPVMFLFAYNISRRLLR